MTIAIFGGSFDPPHLAHLQVAAGVVGGGVGAVCGGGVGGDFGGRGGDGWGANSNLAGAGADFCGDFCDDFDGGGDFDDGGDFCADFPAALPKISRLFVVPAWQNPFKNGFFAPPELRLGWSRAAFGAVFENLREAGLLTLNLRARELQEKISVCDYEIARGEPTPTLITAQFLRQKCSADTIFIIVGQDNLAQLSKWFGFDNLTRIAKFIIITRGQDFAPNSAQICATKSPAPTAKNSTGFTPSPRDANQATLSQNLTLSQPETLKIPPEILPHVKGVLRLQNPVSSTALRNALTRGTYGLWAASQLPANIRESVQNFYKN